MLYLCATPIGNLQDVTFRLVEVLKQADVIFAEDTRHTLQLLNHLGIEKPLASYHKFNEQSRVEHILGLLDEGKNVALVSDAGMPCISDPGGVIAAAAAKAGKDFTVVPGACAAVTALALSGLDCDRFVFEGFLPRVKSKMQQRLSELAQLTQTLIFYESPQRLGATLETMAQTFGNRPAAVCRELTKLHEEAVRLPLTELAKHYSQPPKGECVIVVSGVDPAKAGESNPDELLENMRALMADGMKPKAAAKRASGAGFSANELYALYIKNIDE